MSLIKDVLEKAVALNASDIHLKPDKPPFFRIKGDLVESGLPQLPAEMLPKLVADIVPAQLRAKLEPEDEIDFSHLEKDVGRFRVNVFLSNNKPTFAFRHVKALVPSFEELHLPPILKDLAAIHDGIMMLCGATSCGKSTTLAAIIQSINLSECCRIITIEDPVEYMFQDERAVITQREVGLDTVSFHTALRNVLREDPDVIMIGEMRDAISMSVALRAAETGDIVLSTLHANTSSQAVQRILNFFPAEEHEQIRLSLSDNLRAIICQRLIAAVKVQVMPAVEIMINTPMVKKLLLKNQLDMLHAAIETGSEDGMQTFNQAILKLIKSGDVTEAEGLKHSPNPDALRMNLQGIFLDEGNRILGEAT